MLQIYLREKTQHGDDGQSYSSDQHPDNIRLIDEIEDVLETIYNAFYESKQIDFVVSGCGRDDWGMDCKFDLPCVIENLSSILSSILKSESFYIDFYEQGRECLIHFIYQDNAVKISCLFYADGNKRVECLTSDRFIQDMFISLFNSFTLLSELLFQDIINNNSYKSWKSNNQKIVQSIHSMQHTST